MTLFKEKRERSDAVRVRYYMNPEKKMYDRRDRCNIDGMFGVIRDNASRE